jgi:site-specific DNA-methyltransferase (adenine-specific)
MGETAATWEPIDSIKPWAKNPRKNDGEPVDRVAKSIERFGFSAPIVVRAQDNRIIAGHTRWKAAQKLGMTQVPVRFMPLDEDQAAALALADNRLSEITPWDDEGLAEVLRELEGASFDLDGLGWTAEELEGLMGLEEERPEPTDDVPDVQAEVFSVLGEVYELGPHRLWCGDNTDPAIRAAACAGVGAVVTDPPYGIAAPRAGTGSKSQFAKGDKSERGAWDDEAPAAAWLLKVAPEVIVWGGNYFDDLPVSSDWLVWHKKNDGLRFAEAELAWTNCSPLVRVLQHHWSGEKKEHITQKPMPVMVWSVGFVAEGVVVLDPFGGSGTTLLACAATGRVARLIELDPKYCDVIRRRWTRYAREAGIDPGPGALEG